MPKIFRNTIFFKKTLCWVLIFSILLSLTPDIVDAKKKAGKILEDVANWISKKIGQKLGSIFPTEIVLDEEGDLEIRTSSGKPLFGIICLTGLLGLKADKEVCPNEDECFNPFSCWTLGENKTLTADAEGKPRIPTPAIPSLCELKIMPPPEEQEKEKFLSLEERRILDQACYDVLRVRRAAANMVYFSKHLYNKTDPLSDCFMFSNCKTSCNVSLGTIYYAVSWVDVAKKVLNPLGLYDDFLKLVELIQKLDNVYKVIKPIEALFKLLKDNLKELLNTYKQGKVFLRSFDKVLKIMNEGGLRKLLGHFADNLIKFYNGKSAALAYITNTQQDIATLIQELQREPGIDVFFEVGTGQREKNEKLQKIINDYILAGFETPEQIIEKFKTNGDFLTTGSGFEKESGESFLDPYNNFKTGPAVKIEGKGKPQPPTVSNWAGKAISADGKHQTGIEIIQEENKLKGKIYTSLDYGWTLAVNETLISINSSLNPAIAPLGFLMTISSNGQHQAAVVRTRGSLVSDQEEQIYISHDYGKTWTPQQKKDYWRYLHMSDDGKYLNAITGTSWNVVYTSSNYGQEWNLVTSPDPKWILDEWPYMTIAMSGNGQYQTLAVKSHNPAPSPPPRPSAYSPIHIFNSSDFGQTWNFITSSSDGYSYENPGNPLGLVMSKDGKYQTLTSGGSGGGKIWTSLDYGQTWTARTEQMHWSGALLVSKDGEIQEAGTSEGKNYISKNYGESWTIIDNPDNLWQALEKSGDGQYQTVVTASGKIYTSENYGNDWIHRANISGWDSSVGVITISDDGQGQSITVFGGIRYVSDDFGRTWVREGESNKGLCYQPGNKWLKYFKKFYLKQNDLLNKINNNTPLTPDEAEEIIDLKEKLLAEVEKLSVEKETGANGEIIEIPQYWATSSVDLSCPGGELVDDGRYNFCRFNASTCPSDWKPYDKWSTTCNRKCWAMRCGPRDKCGVYDYYNSTNCKGSSGSNDCSRNDPNDRNLVSCDGPGYCYPWLDDYEDDCPSGCGDEGCWERETGEHSWANKEIESSGQCCVKCDVSWGDDYVTYANCAAKITQIGCVPAVSSAGDAEPMDDSGQYTTSNPVFYRFDAKDCPKEGWRRYPSPTSYWSTTEKATASTECCRAPDSGKIYSRECAEHAPDSGSCSSTNCYDYELGGLCRAVVTTNEHKWSNQSQEQCSKYCLVDIPSWNPDRWINASATAKITEIGCKRESTLAPMWCDYDPRLALFDWDSKIDFIKDDLTNRIFKSLLRTMASSSGSKIESFKGQPFLNWILDKKQQELEKIKTDLTTIKNSIPSDQTDAIAIFDGFISQIENLKTKFEDIKSKAIEIKNIWSRKAIARTGLTWENPNPSSDAQAEALELKRNYVLDILDTVTTSQEMAALVIAAENEFNQLKEIGECLLKEDNASCLHNLPPPPGAEPMNSDGEPTTNDQAVFYRFNDSACRGSWKQHLNWSTTKSVYGNYALNSVEVDLGLLVVIRHIAGSCELTQAEQDNADLFVGCCEIKQNNVCIKGKSCCTYYNPPGENCNIARTGFHTWQDLPVESVSVSCKPNSEDFLYGRIVTCIDKTFNEPYRPEGTGGSCNFNAKITQIGCIRLSVNLSDDIKNQLKAIFGDNGSLKSIEKFLLTGSGSDEWAGQDLKDLIGEYKTPDSLTEEECQNGNKGFLNKISCFEKEIEKTFKEILIFINTMIRTSELIPRLEKIRAKIVVLEPQINLDYEVKTDQKFSDYVKETFKDTPLGPSQKDFISIKEDIQGVRCELFNIYSLTRGGMPMKEDGTPATTAAETKFYKFSKYVCGSTTCPVGWKPYKDWSTTEPGSETDLSWDPEDCTTQGTKEFNKEGSCSDITYNLSKCGAKDVASRGSHQWSDKDREYCKLKAKCDCRGAGDKWGDWQTLLSPITEIGCVPDETSPDYQKAREIQATLDKAVKAKVKEKVDAVFNGINDLEFKIFGDKKIRDGCRSLDILLKADPIDIQDSCKCAWWAGMEAMDENGDVIYDWPNAAFYRFNTNVCPKNWKPYLTNGRQWTTTARNGCVVVRGSCQGGLESISCDDGTFNGNEQCLKCCGIAHNDENGCCCGTETHNWDNKDPETCTATVRWNCDLDGKGDFTESCSVDATVIQIGCVPNDPSLMPSKEEAQECKFLRSEEIRERCSEEVIKTEMETLVYDVAIYGNRIAIEGETIEGDEEANIPTTIIEPDYPRCKNVFDKCGDNIDPNDSNKRGLLAIKTWEEISEMEKMLFANKTYNNGTDCVENGIWKEPEDCAAKICEQRGGCGPIEEESLIREIEKARIYFNKDQCPELSFQGLKTCVVDTCQEKAGADYSGDNIALAEQCLFYQEILAPALRDKCGQSEQKEECQNTRNKIGDPEGIKKYCLKKWPNTDPSFLHNDIPDLTAADFSTSSEAIKSVNDALTETREICQEQRKDIITPLEEVLDVYWIILGIKSGYLFYKGLKGSRDTIERIIDSVKALKDKIKDLPDKIEAAWNEKPEPLPKGGIKMHLKDFLRCRANPAIGQAGRTSPAGGPVCPDVSHFTTIIEGNFTAMRQSLMELDLKRRNTDLKAIFAHAAGKLIPDLEEWLEKKGIVYKHGPLYDNYLEPLFNDTKEIKKQAQMVWVLNTAINFAVANCTCGQSFCQFPVCVSGLPLTPDVYGNGYCYVVYVFRAPLKHAAEKLERMLLSR